MEAIRQPTEAMRRPPMSGKRAVLAVASASVALLLLVLSMGGSAPTAAATTATSSAEAKVKIKNFEFKPQKLNVAKGTKVVFANASAVAHTATRKGVFDTGRIKPGNSVSVRFGQKGTFPYFCKPHPFMRGTIVVG
jgi:plastocyanin